MNKILNSVMLVAVLTTASTSVSAFDDQKEGFLVGIGAGVAKIKTEVDVGSLGADDTSLGLATSFKIGYGFTNQFALYYRNDVNWFGYDSDPQDDTYISGLTGIAANYFIEENSPYYLTAGVGVGSFANFTNKTRSETGSAYTIGAGYEVAPHVSLEATYLSNTIEEKNVELSTGALRLTVNYMWY